MGIREHSQGRIVGAVPVHRKKLNESDQLTILVALIYSTQWPILTNVISHYLCTLKSL